MKIEITVEDVLARLPPACTRRYVVNFVDHQGRKFIQSYYVDRDKDAPGWFVWGTSKSGATQIVARPMIARCRNRSGARVRPGWAKELSAQEVADLLSSHEMASIAQTVTFRNYCDGF